MWVEDPPGSGRGHLVHHILDFGKAFGSWAAKGGHRHDGFAPHFDYGEAAASLAKVALHDGEPSADGLQRLDREPVLVRPVARGDAMPR